MYDKASDPLRTVTTLMMVREMPEADFNTLCESLLDTKGLALDPETILDVTGRSETLRDVVGPRETIGDAVSPHGTSCALCGGPLGEVTAITEATVQATGMLACKACIDTALAVLFGPRDEDGSPATRAAGSVIQLAAAIRGGKPQPRLGRRHAA